METCQIHFVYFKYLLLYASRFTYRKEQGEALGMIQMWYNGVKPYILA